MQQQTFATDLVQIAVEIGVDYVLFSGKENSQIHKLPSSKLLVVLIDKIHIAKFSNSQFAICWGANFSFGVALASHPKPMPSYVPAFNIFFAGFRLL
jgi:hypothetical protein